MPWFAHPDSHYGRSGHLERKTCIHYTADFFAIWQFNLYYKTASNSGEIKRQSLQHFTRAILGNRHCRHAQLLITTCGQHLFGVTCVMWCASDGVLSEIAVGAAASNCCVFSSQLSASMRLQQLLAAASNCCVSCLHSAKSACSQPAAWNCSSFKFGWLYAYGVGTIVVRTCKCLSVQLKFICTLVLHYASVGGARWRHTVVIVCVCVKFCNSADLGNRRKISSKI